MQQIVILHKNFPFSEENVENKNRHSKYLKKKNNIICRIKIKIKKCKYVKLKIEICHTIYG